MHCSLFIASYGPVKPGAAVYAELAHYLADFAIPDYIESVHFESNSYSTPKSSCPINLPCMTYYGSGRIGIPRVVQAG